MDINTMISRRDELAQMSRDLAFECLAFGFHQLNENDKRYILFIELWRSIGTAESNQTELISIYTDGLIK